MVDEHIEFRHLQCFVAVAQHGSLPKAADVLSITQPAGSKTLKELEGLLAARLFERGRKGAALSRGMMETLSVSSARGYTLQSDAVWVSPDLEASALVQLLANMAGTEELVGLTLRADTVATGPQRELIAAIRLLPAKRRQINSQPFACRVSSIQRPDYPGLRASIKRTLRNSAGLTVRVAAFS